MNLNKKYYILILIFISIVTLAQCVDDDSKTNSNIQTDNNNINLYKNEGLAFVHDSTCNECHAQQCKDFYNTTHYQSSGLPNQLKILGSFKDGENIYTYDKGVQVKMSKVDGNFYQSAIINGLNSHTQKFDIVVGAGLNGQTYLYWKDNGLYQLPISYYKAIDGWGNSPGYPPGEIHFERNIIPRCLECHTTYAEIKNNTLPYTYTNGNMILGVGCQKCHGPALDHVNYHRNNKNDTLGKHIINAGKMSRQQQLDACALCHAGTGVNIGQAFTFKPGDNLKDFLQLTYSIDSSEKLDVHGNQYGLMMASACAKGTNLTCSSCHNVHEKQKGNLQMFSNQCMKCHQESTPQFCSAKKSANILKQNCIDCHMPVFNSQVLPVIDKNKTINPVKVRTHLIKVYK